jgi:hypothetical protein
MALISKRTPEQRAIEAGIKEQKREEEQQQREKAAAEQKKQRENAAAEQQARERALRRKQVRDAFFAAPAGEARLAFERGDRVFQYSIDAIKTTDPVTTLNFVCNEGWELVNGSFVFVEEGQQSRDKVGGGASIATRGTTVAYYLFRRAEANQREKTEPWEET